MSKWESILDRHPNSISAYYEGKLNGEFSDREDKIMTALRAMGSGTDREVSEFLGFNHKSAVQPRISDLIEKAKLIEECGSKHDDITNKTVRIVRIIPQEDINQRSLF